MLQVAFRLQRQLSQQELNSEMNQHQIHINHEYVLLYPAQFQYTKEKDLRFDTTIELDGKFQKPVTLFCISWQQELHKEEL